MARGFILQWYFSIPARPGRPAQPAYLKDIAAGSRSMLAKARRLAAKHGVVIERDGGDYWVTHPAFNEGTDGRGLDAMGRIDPCNGAHFCVGGDEVLQAVVVYANFFAEHPPAKE